MEAKYEDLVRSPRETVRAICAFLGVAYSDSLLDFEESGRRRIAMMEKVGIPAERRRSAIRIAGPLDPGRVGRWRTEMSPEEVAVFRSHCGPLLAELYPDGPGEPDNSFS
jgi:hypothetical protein